MLFILALLSAASAQQASASAATTDIGSILKTMDQAKLSSIPDNVRAVFKKMPEEPTTVTTDDRAAITACLTSTTIDTLGKEACAAMQDQFTVVLDKKRVSNANMQKFVTDALAAGAKMPA